MYNITRERVGTDLGQNIGGYPIFERPLGPDQSSGLEVAQFFRPQASQTSGPEISQSSSAAHQPPRRPRSHNDYGIGWICALPDERVVAIAMLDEEHPSLPAPPDYRDDNSYALGSIGYRHEDRPPPGPKKEVEVDDDEEDSEEESEEEEEVESCQYYNKTKVVKKKPRENILVHYSLIASGNRVIKDANFRNELNKTLGGNLLCVEMEAARLLHNFLYIVIQDICNYTDLHKNNN
ncbi:hypothetical protein TWF718_010438 [Orbilia javanica]|uniref:Uncharacterized protein n=1 Tax=Orbilia javanica TaxID=47235 RepID=A0AAN8MI28_9PEZI